MNLCEFINNALTQIAQGVEGAIAESNGKGYKINPSTFAGGNTSAVHFDLSVECEKQGGADIKVVSGSVLERTANRITFDIVMQLPCTSDDKKEELQKERGKLPTNRDISS